jgi:hypothetical protein
VIGEIIGRWTDKVYFNKSLIFDVNKQQSHLVFEESRPLASDSCFRKDLKILKTGDIDKAQ